jgi:hypothetical protein
MTHVKQQLDQIARKHLRIPTLECRKSDRLDFHDVSVWAVHAALNAAYRAGAKDKYLSLVRKFDRKLDDILDAVMDSDSPSFTTEQVEFLEDRLRFTSATRTCNTEGE